MLINFLLVMATSGIVGFLLILLHHRIPKLNELRDDLESPQRSHLTPTPRLGGLAILAGVVTILFVQQESSSTWFTGLCISLIPVAATGLAEDMGIRVRPRWRLLAAALSSLWAISVLDIWLSRVDIVGMDLFMQSKVFAFTFTVVATAGVCHAFNLIDGINGLAGSFAVSSLIGLSVIAGHAENTGATEIGLLLIGVILGFLLLNFPFGKLFLGDAGAYSIGHLVVWYAIYLVWEIDGLTTWAIALTLFWPVMDTLYSMYRRSRAGKPMSQPDRLHFHQVVLRAIQISSAGRIKLNVANPLATIVIIPFFAGPIIAGTLLWNQPLLAACTLVGFSLAFVLTYQFLMGFAKLRQKKIRTRVSGSVVRQSI